MSHSTRRPWSVDTRRGAGALAGTVALLAALAPAAQALAPAQAPAAAQAGVQAGVKSTNEVTLRPASGLVRIDGRGFGHGRGMSQWGAYGAAVSGLSWQQILGFYYPGTVRSTSDDSTIKVWITRDTTATTVLPAPGLSVTVGATRIALPADAAHTAWRALPSAGALAVQYRDAKGAWQPFSTPKGGDVAFATSSGIVTAVHGADTQELRGTLHAVLDGSKLRTVLWSSMESYLRGVVPNEMPASWHTQALAAQAVAARTYAASYRAGKRTAGAAYDICDTTSCQVFDGVARTSGGSREATEDRRASAAIALTAGTVLRTKGGGYAWTEFSASNGGYSTDGDVSYLVAKADPYDGKVPNGSNSWSVTAKVSSVERALGVGTLRSMTVTRRDGNGPLGGRVLGLKVVGSARTVEVSGAKLRSALGLKSDWFSLAGIAGPPAPGETTHTTSVPTPAPTPAAVKGDGGVLVVDAAGRLLSVGASGASTQVGSGWRGRRPLATGPFGLLSVDGAGVLRAHAKAANGTFAAGRVVGRGWTPATSPSAVTDARGSALVALRGGSLVRVPVRSTGALGPAAVAARGVAATRVRGAGDLTGDGLADLVAVTKAGRLEVLPGTKAGFAAPILLGGGWASMRDLAAAGDLTGDGKADLVALDRTGRLRVYPGTGTGRFGAGRALGGVTGAVSAAR